MKTRNLLLFVFLFPIAFLSLNHVLNVKYRRVFETGRLVGINEGSKKMACLIDYHGLYRADLVTFSWGQRGGELTLNGLELKDGTVVKAPSDAVENDCSPPHPERE